jgi:hypothetical protein
LDTAGYVVHVKPLDESATIPPVSTAQKIPRSDDQHTEVQFPAVPPYVQFVPSEETVEIFVPTAQKIANSGDHVTDVQTADVKTPSVHVIPSCDLIVMFESETAQKIPNS